MTHETNEFEPKRCPICESTHLSKEKADMGKYYIRCDHCNILVAIIKSSENKGEEDEVYEYKSS